MQIKIGFWFNPDGEYAVADLELNGVEHQTWDTREFDSCLVLSKKTIKANQSILSVEDKHTEIGYVKKEYTLDAEIHAEPHGYTYVILDRTILTNILKNAPLIATGC